MTHWLKTWPNEFAAVRDGSKRFEYRSEEDRDFAVGDKLCLCLWERYRGQYVAANGESTTRGEDADRIMCSVTYVLHGGRFGVPVGFCVMSIDVVKAL